MTRPSRTLTVVTYNIRAAIGPGAFPPAWWRHVDRARLERIGEIIAGLGPDLVALQEVALMTVDGVVLDQAAELARLAGLEPRYGATAHFPIVDAESGETIGAAFWGNAILSRWPIGASRAVALPIAGDDDLVEPAGSGLRLAGIRYADAPVGSREVRCLLACEVGVDAVPVNVVSTHLTHVGSGQRRLQAERVAETIAALAGPVVLAGDLNAPIESDELSSVTAMLSDAFVPAGIPPGDSRRRSCGSYAIDHVLVRNLSVGSCRVVPEAGDASDHWPVAATLGL